MSAQRIGLGMIGGLLAAVLFFVAITREWKSPFVTPSPLPLPSRAASPIVPSAAPTVLPAAQTRDVLLFLRTNAGGPARSDPPASNAGSSAGWRSGSGGETGAELLYWDGQSMRTVGAPGEKSLTRLPVTDGTHLYETVAASRLFREAETRLIARDLATQKETLVTGSTPLVTPRSALTSPKGAVVGFFLDNTRDRLTEFWTYDPEKQQKRLAVERLSLDARGPFWAPDGGMIFVDKDRVLRGSPHRTGTDLLPIQRSWSDLRAGNALIPSPAGSQIIAAVAKSGRGSREETDIRVWDLRDQSERTIFTVPVEKVEFLGWTNTGILLLQGRDATGRVSLWSLRKGVQTALTLPADTRFAVLSGDGTRLALLRGDTKHAFVTLHDAEKLQEIQQVPLGEIGNVGNVRLLQYLRPASGTSMSATGGADLAPEHAVRYVMEHIREIAEAPVHDHVTAERVWVTSVPGAVLVDYRVGSTPWRRSVRLISIGGSVNSHSLLGVYAPAAGEWVLTGGTDLPNGTTLILYEFEPDLNQWIRKDTPGDIHP